MSLDKVGCTFRFVKYCAIFQRCIRCAWEIVQGRQSHHAPKTKVVHFAMYSLDYIFENKQRIIAPFEHMLVIRKSSVFFQMVLFDWMKMMLGCRQFQFIQLTTAMHLTYYGLFLILSGHFGLIYKR